MSRIAVVTGGTRGIGAAIATALKDAGYKVVASYAGNDEAATNFKAQTGIEVMKWDVGDYGACETALKKIENDFGPVDILVNNAGITRDSMFHKMTPENWNAVINTNLNSLFNMTRPVWEGMRERGFGRVVCISSINGQKGQMGQANYSAAKAGDIGFVKALAQEGAKKGITVNAICPGYTDTPMLDRTLDNIIEKTGMSRDEAAASLLKGSPTGQFVQPAEIADVVLQLCADDASGRTGEAIAMPEGIAG